MKKKAFDMKSVFSVRTIAFLLLFALSCSLLAGCVEEYDPNMSAKERLIAYWKEDFGEENGTIEFVADTFLQPHKFSAWYSLEIKVINGDIYEYNCLYETVTYVKNPGFAYFAGFDYVRSQNKRKSRILDRIDRQKYCYILECETNEDVLPLAVYRIDGINYFLSLNDNAEVVRVHATNTK